MDPSRPTVPPPQAAPATDPPRTLPPRTLPPAGVPTSAAGPVGVPSRPPAGPPGGPARALFDAPGIRVTTESFTVAGRGFALGELTELRTARAPRDPLAFRVVATCAAIWCAVGLYIGYEDSTHRHGVLTYLVLGGSATVPALVALALGRLRPPDYELWARYRGRQTLLFRTDQERQFGQVTRALLRAREAARLGGLAEPVATSQLWQPPPR